MASDKSIRFSLRESKLVTGDRSPFIARVHSYKTVGQDQIIERMAEMNASISRQELLAVFDLYRKVVADTLARGENVSTDIFNARVSVGGGFDSLEGEYAPGRNEIRVSLSPAPALAREVGARAIVEKVRARKALPQLDSVYDYATVTKNRVLTAGHTAELTGGDLNCDADDPAQGLFFIPAGATEGVRASVIHRQSATRLVFQVPGLEPGTYGLVLRRAYGETIRQGELETAVSVN